MYYAANSFGGGFKIVNDVVWRTLTAAFRFESMTGASREGSGAGLIAGSLRSLPPAIADYRDPNAR
jgi:hypothetical protein